MEPDELVVGLYSKVFEVARHFIDQSKVFSIQEMQEHDDPTYEQVAEKAKLLAATIYMLAVGGGWENERISLNAQQAALHMERMAAAIAKNDKAMLEEALGLLESMSRI